MVCVLPNHFGGGGFGFRATRFDELLAAAAPSEGLPPPFLLGGTLFLGGIAGAQRSLVREFVW